MPSHRPEMSVGPAGGGGCVGVAGRFEPPPPPHETEASTIRTARPTRHGETKCETNSRQAASLIRLGLLTPCAPPPTASAIYCVPRCDENSSARRFRSQKGVLPSSTGNVRTCYSLGSTSQPISGVRRWTGHRHPFREDRSSPPQRVFPSGPFQATMRPLGASPHRSWSDGDRPGRLPTTPQRYPASG